MQLYLLTTFNDKEYKNGTINVCMFKNKFYNIVGVIQSSWIKVSETNLSIKRKSNILFTIFTFKAPQQQRGKAIPHPYLADYKP